jgi:hypothetical protein
MVAHLPGVVAHSPGMVAQPQGKDKPLPLQFQHHPKF